MEKHEMDYCLNDICEMEKIVVGWLRCELAKGQNEANLTEFKELCDGVKDLAEAKKYLMESKYFEDVTEAMETPDIPLEALASSGLLGYNGRHYATSGRFAPAGRGKVMGYDTKDRIPFDMDYIDNPAEFRKTMYGIYGYHDGSEGMGTDVWNNPDAARYGEPYSKWRTARKYYHEGDASKKDDMKHHVDAHITNMIATAGEMFNDSDPEQQNKMMKSLEALLAQWKASK